jgi:hypothetical protein
MPVERVPIVHPNMAATAVAVDVCKSKAVLSVTSADRHRLFGPAEFAMTAPALAAVLQWVCAVPPTAPVRVGVEEPAIITAAAGIGVWPVGWEGWELSPARVSEQRRVQGRRRVKTDTIDWRRSPNWCWLVMGRGDGRARWSPSLPGGRCSLAAEFRPGRRRTISCSPSWTLLPWAHGAVC